MLLFKIYFILYFSTLPCSVALQKLRYNDIFERTKKAVAVFFSGWYMYYVSEILRVTENLKISELNLDISWSSTDARFSTKILSCLLYKCLLCAVCLQLRISVSREKNQSRRWSFTEHFAWLNYSMYIQINRVMFFFPHSFAKTVNFKIKQQYFLISESTHLFCTA